LCVRRDAPGQFSPVQWSVDQSAYMVAAERYGRERCSVQCYTNRLGRRGTVDEAAKPATGCESCPCAEPGRQEGQEEQDEEVDSRGGRLCSLV
jgi:hypothetical protein